MFSSIPCRNIFRSRPKKLIEFRVHRSRFELRPRSTRDLWVQRTEGFNVARNVRHFKTPYSESLFGRYFRLPDVDERRL